MEIYEDKVKQIWRLNIYKLNRQTIFGSQFLTIIKMPSKRSKSQERIKKQTQRANEDKEKKEERLQKMRNYKKVILL